MCFSCTKDTEINQKPNVILIIADDQGYGDLSARGNPYLNTPTLDQLAHSALSFENFYVSPVCSPTRAELLTGKYYPKSGVYSTSTGGERINLDQQILGDYFKEDGYRTGFFGKWHSGQQYPYHPNARGFEEFYGFCSGHLGHYFDARIEHNGKAIRSEGYLTDDLTTKTIEFAGQNATEPFLAVLSLNTPHSPMQVPGQWYKKFDSMSIDGGEREDINHSKAAYAMVENIDHNVKRIIQALKKNGLDENTVLIYMSDNGPNGHRFNAGLKGTKGSTDEGGVKTNFFLKYSPFKGRKIEQLASSIDLLPTLLELCGINIPKGIDGVSLMPSILNNEIKDKTLFHFWNNQLSVRTTEYKLDTRDSLFEIRKDPNQKFPVQNDSVFALLQTQKEKWLAKYLLSTEEKRPFSIANAAVFPVVLPSRDASFSAEVKRSNRWPNDSYLKQWKSLSDSIFWPVENFESGWYYFTLYYTAPKTEVGVPLEIKIKNGSVQQIVEKTFVSEPIGASEDRVRRIESYIKDFYPLRFKDSLFLEKGLDTIVLHRMKSGEHSIEFQKLELSRTSNQ
tara:strand:+ start:22716 stop:24407 length:1692 start_codon:yes stop_codon:yes gene_type:complete